MKQVPLSTLENAIIKPGFEKHLKPLIMYRGAVTLGQIHRMWNLVVSAMEHDATASDLTQRLQHNDEYSQLCGPSSKASRMTLRGFASRLDDNPKVYGEMPQLKEYLDSIINPWERHGRLIPVSQTTYRSRNMGRAVGDA